MAKTIVEPVPGWGSSTWAVSLAGTHLTTAPLGNDHWLSRLSGLPSIRYKLATMVFNAYAGGKHNHGHFHNRADADFVATRVDDVMAEFDERVEEFAAGLQLSWKKVDSDK